jgi:hypothetical protein
VFKVSKTEDDQTETSRCFPVGVFEPTTLHNRRRHNLCSPAGILHAEFWCGNVQGRGQLEYEDNIQTGVEEIKVEGVDWINVAEGTDSGTLL